MDYKPLWHANKVYTPAAYLMCLHMSNTRLISIGKNRRHRPEHLDTSAQKNAPKSTVIALTTACECMRHGLVIAGISHLIL